MRCSCSHYAASKLRTVDFDVDCYNCQHRLDGCVDTNMRTLNCILEPSQYYAPRSPVALMVTSLESAIANDYVHFEFDELLNDGTYYYHIPGLLLFPVFPSFDHYEFPHGTRPSEYDRQATQPSTRLALASATNIAASTTVIDRDRSCQLSRDADILEKAHLSPKHKIDWFTANSMKKYNQYPQIPQKPSLKTQPMPLH